MHEISRAGKDGRMRNLCCRLGFVAALVVLAAGCGSNDSSTSTTTTSRPTATSAVTPTSAAGSTSTTVAPGPVQQGVTDGAVCSPNGARGVTTAGRTEVCGAGGAGNAELRWRPA
jgi:hypothetical protein